MMLSALALTAGIISGLAQTQDAVANLQVDASDAPMHLIHTVETLPVNSGSVTLAYAKWIPGEHMPSGPIENLVNLHIFSGNSELAWRRDLVDMNKFHVSVPGGSPAITVRMDYASPTHSGNFGASPSTDGNLAVINWYENALWPEGVVPDQIRVFATLKMPTGWKNGGSLDVDQVEGDTVRYAVTSVAQLNDHPVVIGRHYRRIDLFPAGSAMGEHAIDLIADSEWALDVPPSRVDTYRNLVREERAVFGGVGHYRKYHWLLTLSDVLGSFGVEHHECADDRGPENMMVDDEMSRVTSDLLPHEFFHSWNGKTMRPSGLINGGYDNPMKDDGLWVYEGMTNYYGEVLAARCGLSRPSDYLDALAADYEYVNEPGRTWRPLQDTADSSPFLYGSPTEWSGLRRGTSFYQEGSLIWLEADAKIRQISHGTKSLDDFCALFEGGGGSGRPFVKPYDSSDVYEALGRIAPFDWHGFFEAKLNVKSEVAPQGGFTSAGYHLAFNDTANPFYSQGMLDVASGLGLKISSDGHVIDSWPGSPAYRGGIPAGSKIIAVNRRDFSTAEFKRVLIAAEHLPGPLEFIIKSGPDYKVVNVDYHLGLRIPHLERISNVPDLISQIIAPRAKL